MDRRVQVKSNQSLTDIVLTEYGSLEAGMLVANQNNMSISDTPVAGELLRVPEVASEAVDIASVTYLRQTGTVIGTLSLPALGYEVVLKPVMHIVPNEIGNPHTIGYYSFDLIELPEFTHVNPLTGGYLSDNTLLYQTEERYVFEEVEESAAQSSITPMSEKSIPYVLPWTVGFGYMLVWSDLAQPIVTTTFRDAEGNEAYCAPMTVLDNISQDVIEHFLGDIDVELVSAGSSGVVLRLIRSHPPIGLSNFRNTVMEWLGAAAEGVPEPADPDNPDKCMVTLGAGTHTVGLKTGYEIEGSIPTSYYPSSSFTMVIKVS